MARHSERVRLHGQRGNRARGETAPTIRVHQRKVHLHRVRIDHDNGVGGGPTRRTHPQRQERKAAQSGALAVIKALDLPRDKVNPLGGAIALGHPLGATGTIRTATLLHGLRRIKGRYGMVTMCIGTGMGAAAIFEAL